MSDLHIVTGAGPVGVTIAEQLAAAGKQVRVLTRSGSGPEHPLVERRKIDVGNPGQLSGEFEGAAAVYHCAGASAYAAKAWRAELIPAQQAVLDEAGKTGTVVVCAENLYSYGRVDRPITEDMPRTADFGKPGVRTELVRAREAHATPTISVGAADFVGPYVRNSLSGEQIFAPILAGKKAKALGRLDMPHSFTYIPDLAAAMIRAAADESLWNSFLHAPTAPPVTQRELIDLIGQAAGVAEPQVLALSPWMLKTIGLISPAMRELAEMSYQGAAPFVLDSSASEQRLGLHPTPLDKAVASTVDWWKTQA
ncbi:NAD-dependent epimerase/dehydratase family protein [Nocardia sp. XZ_19_385]|uniref:NAD-dependent epimerase/dehydratase family protein n=1 Tax=Nocardia sp. XZ_19_385 TaxID=2769488 RepID=UPI00188DF549|nr:NAD-dependent epimerase/dehydratase family protein [Nocardia sp. XZ_19_385]